VEAGTATGTEAASLVGGSTTFAGTAIGTSNGNPCRAASIRFSCSFSSARAAARLCGATLMAAGAAAGVGEGLLTVVDRVPPEETKGVIAEVPEVEEEG
jgi:hypothetical protein